MSRPTVVVCLPADELAPVRAELEGTGFGTIAVERPDELEAVLREYHDVAVALLDFESDLSTSLELYSLLHDGDRDIPCLMVVSPRALERFAGVSRSSDDDEYFIRPYSTESLRWRVEAMWVRRQTVDDGSGVVLQGGVDAAMWSRRATVIAVFNPKGGVGKTTVATNLAAALQLRHAKAVLLVDADTETGHVTTSLDVNQIRSVADAWCDEAEGGQPEGLAEISSAHESGLRLVALTTNPFETESLDPERVTTAINGARAGFDFVIVDLHPSYSPLNLAILSISDRILVPVTPDFPAIQASVKLRDVATQLGVSERLALVINRANSGVSVTDMERTIGIPTLASIRSGGLLFVRAANLGKTVLERYPKEKVTEDFDTLAERLVGPTKPSGAPKPAFRLFGRREPVRA